VNKKDVAEMEIPLPPIEEQRRIAAVLDAADALRTKRRQALAKLDTLTQAIFIDLFGNPRTNARGWDLVPFEKLCPSHLGKMLDQKQQTGQHVRPYLRNMNVRWFEFNLHDLARMDFNEMARAKYLLHPGDVLICEGGEPGRAAVWIGELSECYFQKALHRGAPNRDLTTSEFVVHLLSRLASLGGLVDHISSATIAHLTGKRLKSMEVIAPPLELQQLFGEQVKAVEAIQRRANMSLGSLEAFFASLQQRAFRGDL
jgi:type I restriction enzyme S subunit